MRLIFFAILIICFGLKSFSQNHNIVGIFPSITLEGNFSEKWSYSIFSFLADYPIKQTTQDFIYPAKVNAIYIELVGVYSLNSEWSIAGSYTFERLNPFRDDYRNENRVWLQLQYVKKFNSFNLKNRLRYDFRFIQNRTTEKTDFSPRLRYLVGLDFPINKDNLYFSFYNEFFFDTYKDKISTYSENWAFLGLGFYITQNSRLETGPLIISWIRNSEKDWLNQYFLQVNFVGRLNWKDLF